MPKKNQKVEMQPGCELGATDKDRSLLVKRAHEVKKITHEEMFELGLKGKSLSEIATSFDMTAVQFYMQINTVHGLLTSHSKGLQINLDRYRAKMAPIAMDALMMKVVEGDMKAIAFAMEHLVLPMYAGHKEVYSPTNESMASQFQAKLLESK